MKVIIAGSRTIKDEALVLQAITESGFLITEVVYGGAKGPDTIGKFWAIRNNIPISWFLADWKTHGKAAGPIRNEAMARHADALIAVWDGVSTGTKHMIEAAKRRGLKIHISMPAND